jgi:hypothetical protein
MYIYDQIQELRTELARCDFRLRERAQAEAELKRLIAEQAELDRAYGENMPPDCGRHLLSHGGASRTAGQEIWSAVCAVPPPRRCAHRTRDRAKRDTQNSRRAARTAIRRLTMFPKSAVTNPTAAGDMLS